MPVQHGRIGSAHGPPLFEHGRGTVGTTPGVVVLPGVVPGALVFVGRGVAVSVPVGVDVAPSVIVPVGVPVPAWPGNTKFSSPQPPESTTATAATTESNARTALTLRRRLTPGPERTSVAALRRCARGPGACAPFAAPDAARAAPAYDASRGACAAAGSPCCGLPLPSAVAHITAIGDAGAMKVGSTATFRPDQRDRVQYASSNPSSRSRWSGAEDA